MKTNGKVVPFERPAAYWAVRARRHQAADRQTDRARLLRKALEESGDPRIALELSDLYADMDCLTAAERYLLMAVISGGMTGEACFRIGCCALSRGNEALAEDALDQSLRLDPDGAFSDRAQDLLETYPWTYGAPLPGTARGEVLCRRAREAWAAGRRKDAVSLARRAWKRGRSPEAASLLGALLPPAQAVKYLEKTASDGGKPCFSLAEAYALAGEKDKARQALQAIMPLCDTQDRCAAFCHAAWTADCGDLALRLMDAQMRKAPLSADYLRLRSLCLRRLGREEEARFTLEALLDIDPDDTAALWYRRHPGEMREDHTGASLLAALGAMVRLLPERLRRGPLNRMLHLLVMMLAGRVEIPLIYRAVPALWRRLSPAEKYAADQRRSPCLAGAFAVYLLLSAGKREDAAQLLAAAPGRKRTLRLTRRLIRWSEEDAKDALHQL